ncbi:MAG: hypothetical protein K2Y51_05510 [Gammaproteobacteria bacterium]|nr:hypothetical protein [Gammaproteobacteria bacterium]
MRDLVTSGNVALLALAALLLEVAALATLRTRLRRGLRVGDLLLMTLPGACLLAALYCARAFEDWRGVALALSLALPAHLADLRRRWRATLTRLPA